MMTRTCTDAGSSEWKINPEPAERLRVWLVDDSANFRALLAQLLEDEGGFDCNRQFSCAEEVLKALAAEAPPDAILLDVRMPGIGGLKAVRPIRVLAPGTRVLMLTTFYDSDAKDSALRDGASALLLKTCSCSDIAAAIRDMTGTADRTEVSPAAGEFAPASAVLATAPAGKRRSPEYSPFKGRYALLRGMATVWRWIGAVWQRGRESVLEPR